MYNSFLWFFIRHHWDVPTVKLFYQYLKWCRGKKKKKPCSLIGKTEILNLKLKIKKCISLKLRKLFRIKFSLKIQKSVALKLTNNGVGERAHKKRNSHHIFLFITRRLYANAGYTRICGLSGGKLSWSLLSCIWTCTFLLQHVTAIMLTTWKIDFNKNWTLSLTHR